MSRQMDCILGQTHQNNISGYCDFNTFFLNNFNKIRILEAQSWKEPLSSSIPIPGMIQESS